MNELMDEDVIARLRSALDEVTAESDGLVAADPPRPKVSAARWMAVAAAAVLVVGAAAAIALNRGGAGEVASTPTELPTTSATEPTLIRTVAPRYTLIAEDLVPSQVETVPNALTNEMSVVWALSGDPVQGLFIVRSGPGSPNLAPADTSIADYTMIGEEAVTGYSYGIGLQEQRHLLAQVQPGSGLPWLLPVEPWTYLGMGTGNDGPTYAQTFSSDIGSVILDVGPLANQFLTLASVGTIDSATVAGHEGWKATNAEGVYVLWPAGDSGQWASMTVPASLADRIDGLIAAVVEIPEEAANQPTIDTVLAPTVDTAVADTTPTPSVADTFSIEGDPLPMFNAAAATDPAVGMPAPAVIGFDYEGNQIRIDPAEGPQLVMFQAHWCPHCARNLPNVVTWLEDGTIPSWLPVTLVSTAESPSSGENYPADEWLQEMGWSGRVLRDSNEGDGAPGRAGLAYGASGWPYFVVIGVDGNVLARTSGELTQADMRKLLQGLPGDRTLGRLEIPAIDFDWLVVDNSLEIQIFAGLAPVLEGGPIPGQSVDGGISILWGTRTTYSAPFLNIDKLVADDLIMWVGMDGNEATFEVIGSAVGEDSQAPDGTALELRTYTPEFTSNETLIVFARRTA